MAALSLPCQNNGTCLTANKKKKGLLPRLKKAGPLLSTTAAVTTAAAVALVAFGSVQGANGAEVTCELGTCLHDNSCVKTSLWALRSYDDDGKCVRQCPQNHCIVPSTMTCYPVDVPIPSSKKANFNAKEIKRYYYQFSFSDFLTETQKKHATPDNGIFTPPSYFCGKVSLDPNTWYTCIDKKNRLTLNKEGRDPTGKCVEGGCKTGWREKICHCPAGQCFDSSDMASPKCKPVPAGQFLDSHDGTCKSKCDEGGRCNITVGGINYCYIQNQYFKSEDKYVTPLATQPTTNYTQCELKPYNSTKCPEKKCRYKNDNQCRDLSASLPGFENGTCALGFNCPPDHCVDTTSFMCVKTSATGKVRSSVKDQKCVASKNDCPNGLAYKESLMFKKVAYSHVCHCPQDSCLASESSWTCAKISATQPLSKDGVKCGCEAFECSNAEHKCGDIGDNQIAKPEAGDEQGATNVCKAKGTSCGSKCCVMGNIIHELGSKKAAFFHFVEKEGEAGICREPKEKSIFTLDEGCGEGHCFNTTLKACEDVSSANLKSKVGTCLKACPTGATKEGNVCKCPAGQCVVVPKGKTEWHEGECMKMAADDTTPCFIGTGAPLGVKGVSTSPVGGTTVSGAASQAVLMASAVVAAVLIAFVA